MQPSETTSRLVVRVAAEGHGCVSGPDTATLMSAACVTTETHADAHSWGCHLNPCSQPWVRSGPALLPTLSNTAGSPQLMASISEANRERLILLYRAGHYESDHVPVSTRTTQNELWEGVVRQGGGVRSWKVWEVSTMCCTIPNDQLKRFYKH